MRLLQRLQLTFSSFYGVISFDSFYPGIALVKIQISTYTTYMRSCSVIRIQVLECMRLSRSNYKRIYTIFYVCNFVILYVSRRVCSVCVNDDITIRLRNQSWNISKMLIFEKSEKWRIAADVSQIIIYTLQSHYNHNYVTLNLVILRIIVINHDMHIWIFIDLNTFRLCKWK